MSQGDQHRHYHSDEPRLSSGEPVGRPWSGGKVRLISSPAVLLVALVLPFSLSAQTSAWLRIGANGIPVYTGVDPVPGDRSLGEIRLVQPVVMVHAGALADRLRLVATVNFEGLTLPDGELAPGDWGEGFVDRRHPHTYVHELILSFAEPLGRSTRVSLAAGQGFAPFGTDDPMARPIFRYPVNHHLAQILERAVAVVAIRTGPLLAEAGLFNGDEPERPGQWPRISRFGDSWSARVGLLPISQLELQGSRAEVHSPEHRPGAGTDQSKWSASARWDGAIRHHPVYGLVEWARTAEANGFFVFRSLLAEGAWSWGRSRLQYRFERTDRPEEERTLDPFRSLRPHLENSILGKTRWTIHTAGYGLQLHPVGRVSAAPFVELSYGGISAIGGGLFDPRSFYGKPAFWSVSIGARLTVGMPLHRMGRYGVVEEEIGMNAGLGSHHGH